MRGKSLLINSNDADSGAEETGGKGHNLVQLSRNGFRVPDFFVVSTSAFEKFLAYNGASAKKLHSCGADALLQMEFPKEIAGEIIGEYDRRLRGAKVAVRSSATVEDSEKESLAGKFATVLSVDRDGLLSAIKKVYASLLASDTFIGASMAVIVQKQIMPHKAGVMFVDNEGTMISCVLGQGEMLVSGKESGDTYVVGKNNALSMAITPQLMVDWEGSGSTRLPSVAATKQKLTSFEITSLAKEARKVFEAFGRPQDIEWAIDASGIYILQSRPITRSISITMSLPTGSLLPVCDGKANGEPCFDVKKIPDRDVILVAPYIEIHDFESVLANKRVKGIITETGSMLSHESILSREKGIPYLAGLSYKAIMELVESKHVALDVGKLSVLADGKEIIKTRSESYSWLNKDLVGLVAVKCSGKNAPGMVVRSIEKFTIVYGDVSEEATAKEISSGLKSMGADGEQVLVCETLDRNLPILYRPAVNWINLDGDVSSIVQPMIDSIERFDVAAFGVAYQKALDALKEHFEETRKEYARYLKKRSGENLKSAILSAGKTNGFYKGIRIMPSYFEYALGAFMSDSEGKAVTDVELYALKADYEVRNPSIRKMEDALTKVIDEVDKAVPLSPTEPESFTSIFSSLMAAGGNAFTESGFSALFLGLERGKS